LVNGIYKKKMALRKEFGKNMENVIILRFD